MVWFMILNNSYTGIFDKKIFIWDIKLNFDKVGYLDFTVILYELINNENYSKFNMCVDTVYDIRKARIIYKKISYLSNRKIGWKKINLAHYRFVYHLFLIKIN